MTKKKIEEVKLTDDYKDKLGYVLGFDVNAEFVYVPKAFRENKIPKELWTIWTLTSKDGLDIAAYEDEASDVCYTTNDDGKAIDYKMKFKTGSKRISTLENGIVKVKNFHIENGNILEYDAESKILKITNKNGETRKERNVNTKEIIRHMTGDYQNEIANAIDDRKTLTSEELTGLEY